MSPRWFIGPGLSKNGGQGPTHTYAGVDRILDTTLCEMIFAYKGNILAASESPT